MAYITTEEVREKRNALKLAFPSCLGWKISVTKENYSSINVAILNSPIELRNLEAGNVHMGMRVNVDSKRLTSIGKDVVNEISKIINKGNHDKSDTMIDYFDVGFYARIFIGNWDKDFNVVEVKENKKIAKALLTAA